MGRSPCCEKVGLKKGAWTPEEDEKLLAFVEQYGHGSWRALPVKAGLQRCGKSCRLRWTNYLRPDIKRGKFSLQEEQTIIQLHALLGNRWSAIATHLPKRTDNEIKNYWNTHLKKRLTKMGIDPVTHKPRAGTLTSSTGLSHMAQWESARLEAEARLVRESKLLASSTNSIYHNDNNPVQAAAHPPCLDVLKAWQAQLGAIPSSSNCSSALSAIMALGGDHLESPTSTLTFHNVTKDRAIGTINPIVLPLNDASFYGEMSGGGQWYGEGGPGSDANDGSDKNACHVDGFPDLLVGEYEGYGLKAAAIDGINVGENYVVAGGGEHNHGTDENKNYWDNILMNLVGLNASHSGSNNVVL